MAVENVGESCSGMYFRLGGRGTHFGSEAQNHWRVFNILSGAPVVLTNCGAEFKVFWEERLPPTEEWGVLFRNTRLYAELVRSWKREEKKSLKWASCRGVLLREPVSVSAGDALTETGSLKRTPFLSMLSTHRPSCECCRLIIGVFETSSGRRLSRRIF
jgi:hypothetical protein